MGKTSKNGKGDGNQTSEQNAPSNEQLDYVYRVLRPDEDPSEGLQAIDPTANNVTPSSHVHGKKRSPYISTCATLDAAEMYASLAKKKGYQTGRLVRINIKKLKQMTDVEVIVLNKSHFSKKDSKGKNWAFYYREVLIRGRIPARCIEVIDDYEESEEYDMEDYSSEDQDPEDFSAEDQDPEDFSSQDQEPEPGEPDAKNECSDDESESLSDEFAKRANLSDAEMAFLAALCRYLKQHDSRNGQHQRCSQPFDQRRILRGNDAVNMGNKRSFTTFSARKTLQPRLTFSAISGVKKWSSPSPMKFLSRSFRQKQNLMTTWTNKVTISGIIVGYVTVLSIIKVHFNYR